MKKNDKKQNAEVNINKGDMIIECFALICAKRDELKNHLKSCLEKNEIAKVVEGSNITEQVALSISSLTEIAKLCNITEKEFMEIFHVHIKPDRDISTLEDAIEFCLEAIGDMSDCYYETLYSVFACFIANDYKFNANFEKGALLYCISRLLANINFIANLFDISYEEMSECYDKCLGE